MPNSPVILWTVVHQAPLSMGFSRQEYWSGLPSPSSGNLPDPGIESIFGFDEDTEESFIKTLEFSRKHEFFVIAFNHLLTFPNTPTYKEFQEQGRLICDKWWLQDGYTFGTISFVPKQVTAEELRALCRKYKKKFFKFGSVFKRGITCFKRTKKPLINFAYWYINILFHFEVDKRIGIPVGENLEEARK